MDPHALRRNHRLPGTRFATEDAAALPRLAAGAAWLLGPPGRRRLHDPDRRRAERAWAASAVSWLRLRIAVTGVRHVDPQERYVVAPLHEGFADALALLTELPLGLRFVARDELRSWALLGRVLERGEHPAVTPESGIAAYRTMLRAAGDVFSSGDSLVVFPQGSILGIEAGFSPGAFRLAAATGRPLLPVVLSGTHRVWEHPFSPLVRFDQPVSMQILPPLQPDTAVAAQRALERTMKSAALASPVPPRRFVPERDGWWDGYRYTIDPDFPDLAARIERHRRLIQAELAA